MAQFYEGHAYIGVVGSEIEYGVCYDSIQAIQRRPGDLEPVLRRGTKGYENRQWHINNFMTSGFNWLLLLDSDMTFPPQTLERLRGWGKPFVSGFYMRRTIRPVSPVWFEDNPQGLWPARPWFGSLEGLTEPIPIGASGWGCMLIHRAVIEDVRAKVLKGEDEVIEDDLDVWPYDLDRIMAAKKRLREIQEGTAPDDGITAEKCLQVLDEEIRPLRGRKDSVGSDIRYPYLARAAGWQLWGDPTVRCGHVASYPISAQDWINHQAGPATDEFRKINEEMIAEREAFWSNRLMQLGVTHEY